MPKAAHEEDFVIQPGRPAERVNQPEETPAQILGSKGIEKIYAMILDGDTPIADISRLIALEIVNVMRLMTHEPRDPSFKAVGKSQKDLNDQIKAYRELQRTLTESDQLSKKDVLNLDGEKFAFVLTEIVKWFRTSLTDAGVDDTLAHNIMLQFGDKVKGNDAPLRIELNKIGTGR